MRAIGEVSLLVSLIFTGFASALHLCRPRQGRRSQFSTWVSLAGCAALTVVTVILICALLNCDFRYAYVAQYASRLLPWSYRVSALWVGQAGSLLLWAWMLCALALVVKTIPTAHASARDTAFGLLMANVCFLIFVMVFAADPMAHNSIVGEDGAGLSPLLQAPSMLVHPPVVFLAYAAWAVPCALTLAALWNNCLDANWIREVRPWALIAWTILGAGLLLGANWAYQELGWGGYWGWDPVENGSLLPWLTGTAFIHCLMTWRARGQLKKTAIALAVVTCAFCNFATFLTRSGVYSSVHAFSQSPIGWMFLGFMALLLVVGVVFIFRLRHALEPDTVSTSLFARESLIVASTFLIVLLAIVVLIGTSIGPASKLLAGRSVEIGPSFYNNALPPIGIGLLAMTAAVPLLRWGSAPTRRDFHALVVCIGLGLAAAVFFAAAEGVRHPIALAVIGLVAFAVASMLLAGTLAIKQRKARYGGVALMSLLSKGRRKYAAYTVHCGFICIAIGITGSSIGTRRQEFTLSEGDVVCWEGRQIRYQQLEQRQDPDKLVAEAVLFVTDADSTPLELRPARHLFLLQNEWTTEVAIHSTWKGDFYTILNAGLGEGRVVLTFISNPMMRWLWVGGVVSTLGAVVAVWPSWPRRSAQPRDLGRSFDPLDTDLAVSGKLAA